MSKYNRKNKNQIIKKKAPGSLEWWLYLPIIIAFGYSPMLVHSYKYYRESLELATWFNGNAAIDFSLAYKAICIMLCAVFAVIFFLVSLYKYPIKKDRIFIPAIVYAGLVLISGIFSPWKDFAFQGGYEIFESVPVILSYLALGFCAMHFISYDGERGIRIIMRGALPGLFFVMIVGFFEYFGANLINTQLAESFIIGSDISTNTGIMNVRSNAGTIVSTLYNSNYLGTFYSVITPVFLFLGIATKIKYEKIVLFIAVFLGLFNLYGSNSFTGYMTVGGLVLFFIVLFGYKKGKMMGIAASAIVAVICVIGVILSFTWGPIKNRIWTEFGLGEESYSSKIDRIVTDGEGIKYYYGDKAVIFSYDVYGEGQINLKAKDQDGKFIKVTPLDERRTKFEVEVPGFDEPFYVAERTIGEKDVTVVISGGGLSFTFYNSSAWKNFYDYRYISRSLKAIPFPETPEKAKVFPDSFMGRGGMWNVTIPTLRDHMIIGSGANTYCMVYPQVDELVFGPSDLDVKPHSLYLQQWSDNGFIAMIAYMVLFIWAIVRGGRRFYGDTEGTPPSPASRVLPPKGEDKNRAKIDWVSLGFILGIAANLIAGIANDSMVVTGALVWTVLGMGIGWFKTEGEAN